jgi:hypothetical protein
MQTLKKHVPIQLQQDETKEYVLGVIILFSACACVIFSSIMYIRYTPNSLLLTTTKPFIDFYLLKHDFEKVTTIAQAFSLNRTLLQTAWCNEPTGNYNRRWETRADACVCINDKYLQFMKEVLQYHVNNSNTTDLIMHYLASPWVNDTVAETALAVYINSSEKVHQPILDGYIGTISTACINSRAVWKIEPYAARFNPVVSSLYCSIAYAMFGFLYVFKVNSANSTGWAAKWFMFFIAIASSAAFFAMDTVAYWFYGLAVLYIAVNYITSLKDEFMSIVEQGDFGLDIPNTFFPPHPLMVGTWNYLQVLFPVVVMYMGMANLLRDITGLFVLYVIGYGIICTIQRRFWTHFFINTNMIAEATDTGNKTHHIRITSDIATVYRNILFLFFNVVFVLLFFFGSVVIFTGWYNQSLVSGNWFALVMGFLFLLIFLLDYAHSRNLSMDNPLPLTTINTVQVILTTIITILFCISTGIDVSLP